MEWYFWVLIAAAVASALRHLSAIRSSSHNTAAMTKRLLAHHGIEWECVQEPSAKVRELARMPGSDIAATRAYREQTGLGVKEARAVIDGLRVTS